MRICTWIDPTSLEFIGRVVGQIQDKKLLLVLSHRPEWRADFTKQEYVTGLTLNRLGVSQVRELIRAIAGSGVDERFLDDIEQRTDGIPLYIEEFTRAVLEAGTVDGDFTVPESLLSSLMARLDRLQEAKHVAQIASVIGRDFGRDLLSGIIDLPEQQLETALQRILSTGLVRKIDLEGGAAYEFKHALVRDAAYESLLRQDRREIHRRIADNLASQHGENVETKPEVLALHYGQAGDWGGELKNWRLAGKRSVDSGAVAEAAALFENALKALESMDAGKDRDRIEMEILLDLAPAAMTLRGYAAQEPKTYYDRAYELAREVGDVDQQFTALWGGYYITEMRAYWKESEKNIKQLLTLDVSKLRPDLALQIDHAAMTYNSSTANFSKSVFHSRRISAAYDEDLHASHKYLFGAHDPCVCAHNQLAWSLILMGYPEQALDAVNQAEKLGRALNHPPSLAHALWAKCNCYLALEEFERARDSIEETIAHCTEYRVWPILKTTEFYQLAAMADREQAYGGLSARIDPMRERGRHGLYIPYLSNLCAMLAVELGHRQHALDTLDYSHNSAVATGEAWAQGQNFYLRGKALQLAPDPDIPAAESAFRDGIELCQQQQAKYYGLRSSMGLAEIHLEAGDPAAARAILEPVYRWFTEGFDRPVLRRAKEILERIR